MQKNRFFCEKKDPPLRMNSFAHELILLTLRRVLFEIHNQALIFFKIFSMAEVNSNKRIRKQTSRREEASKQHETIHRNVNLGTNGEEFRPD